MQSLESLEVIGKLVRNIVVAPTDAKYRQVKLANAKVSRPPRITHSALSVCWLLCTAALPVLKALLLSCALTLSAPGSKYSDVKQIMSPAPRPQGKPGACRL